MDLTKLLLIPWIFLAIFTLSPAIDSSINVRKKRLTKYNRRDAIYISVPLGYANSSKLIFRALSRARQCSIKFQLEATTIQPRTPKSIALITHHSTAKKHAYTYYNTRITQPNKARFSRIKEEKAHRAWLRVRSELIKQGAINARQHFTPPL